MAALRDVFVQLASWKILLLFRTSFQRFQPQLMSVVHGMGKHDPSHHSNGTFHHLFRDDVATFAGLEEKKRVIRTTPRSIPEPSEPLIRNKFVDLALSVRAKCFPRESGALVKFAVACREDFYVV